MDLHPFVRTPAVTCMRETPIGKVARLMEAHGVGSVVVMDQDEQLAGIVTDRDLVTRARAEQRGLDTPVSKVMSEDVVFLRDDATLFAAATEIATAGCRRMPVLDKTGMVMGLVTLDDLLVVFARQTDKLSEAIASEIAHPSGG
jgi:signal-transduction protein with cAMP-binding, CBS, and nucleotidyltransferase domain